MAAAARLAFVTIGETPRVDLVPEMLKDIGTPVEAHEYGVLDGLSDSDIASLAPLEGEGTLATRRRDGREVTLSKPAIEVLLDGLLRRIDTEKHDAIVLLCTGTRVEPPVRTLLIEAQRVVDATVDAMGASCRRLGVIVPLARQAADFAKSHSFPVAPRVVDASPYAGDRLGEAAALLADCDLVVMHCMGYSEHMRATVARAVDAPVLLARRIVSGAVRQIL